MQDRTDAVNRIRPEIRDLTPYSSPAFDYEVKLDLNESPFDVPPEAKERIFDRVRKLPWQLYHDEFERPLKKALAGYSDHPEGGVLVGNGSNELIFHSLLSVVRSGQAVLYPEPSFSLYAQNVRVLGGEPVPFSLAEDDYSVDTARLIDLAREHDAAAIVLCSPNNPTGNRTSNEAIAELCAAVDSLVIVDEAYAPFAGGNAGPLLGQCPNLVLLRTFSKAFGLAGLRFGYLLAAPLLAAEIGKVQLPHHVNFFTQLTALSLLEQTELVDRRVAELKQWRGELAESLSGIRGIRPLPSETNFIMIECADKPAGDVFNGLLERGVLVRNISGYPGLGRCLRITVGLPEQNRRLVEALAEVAG